MLSSLILASTILASVVSMPVEAPKFDMEGIISALIWCESKGDKKAWNDNDGAIGEHSMGILQFKLKTWNWAINRYKFSNTDFKLPGFDKGIIQLPAKQNGASTTITYVRSENYLDILNPEHQKLVAREIIKDGRGSKTWKVYWRKMKLNNLLNA